MSALRKVQQKPFSPQEETQMSKCDIDRLVSVVSITVYCIAHLMAVSYQN